MPRGLRAVPLALLILGGFASVLAHGGVWWWPLDLLTHFRAQYLVLFTLLLVVTLVLRQWRTALATLLFVVQNAVMVMPLMLDEQAPRDGARALSLLVANVNSRNTNYARLLAQIAERKPDVVVVLEVSEGWARALDAGLGDFATHQVVARDDNFGIAFFARTMVASKVVDFVDGAGAGPPSIVAHVPVGDRVLMLVATHPVPPIGGDHADERDAQLAAIAGFVADQRDVVIAGDLNASPWSSALWPLTDVGFRDTRRGFGIHATWPASFMPLRVPIDYVLASPSLVAWSHEVLPDIGSDHLPIAVELGWQTR